MDLDRVMVMGIAAAAAAAAPRNMAQTQGHTGQ